jgi:hypothetical protein
VFVEDGARRLAVNAASEFIVATGANDSGAAGANVSGTSVYATAAAAAGAAFTETVSDAAVVA